MNQANEKGHGNIFKACREGLGAAQTKDALPHKGDSPETARLAATCCKGINLRVCMCVCVSMSVWTCVCMLVKRSG